MKQALTAPGRLDVVERTLRSEPFFKSIVNKAPAKREINRLGRAKRYSTFTVKLVTDMARRQIDAVTLCRAEIIANAVTFLHI